MLPARLSLRIGTGALLLALSAAAAGCVTSEKSRYDRHLSALVPQRPVGDGNAALALRPRGGDGASLGGLREEPVEGP